MILGLMLTVILLPFAGGVLLQLIKFKEKRSKQCFIFAYVLINTLLTYILLAQGPTDIIRIINFAGAKLNFSLKIDGMGIVFGGLVATLWPLATLYSFPYMEHEHNGRVHENIFYLFYTATYGVTLGIAMSGNMLTMYCFYELLTLVTVPLVMNTLTREAVLASRKYFYYSLGGAAFAFIGLIFLIVYGDSLSFIFGGVLTPNAMQDKKNLLLFIYVLAFMGFGVKAAICPFNAWLPQAGVAPTPVTALLHAVAVVKSGAFAIMRLTYYSFGVDFLRGTWAQYLLMCVVIFTIVYGCSMAVKETHIKRRLAFSTISNLSYIWRPDYDAAWLGRRSVPHGFSRCDENLFIFLRRCNDYAGTCEFCARDRRHGKKDAENLRYIYGVGVCADGCAGALRICVKMAPCKSSV